MKKLNIVDKNTGEILEETEFTGGYHFIYNNLEDGGKMHHIRKLDNAKFGDKHQIKNLIYRPIALALKEKFEELQHINPYRILFIEDMDWENKDKSKRQWIARMSLVNKQFYNMTGYGYILETRNWFIERMRREQIIALIYHELRHIGTEGEIVKHDIEDWNNMVATLGTDWATTEGPIKDLLEDEIIWEELEPVAKQLNVFNLNEYKAN